MRTFGRYELIERIDVGGMAEVFKARQRGAAGFERVVAIKRILPAIAADAMVVRMFIEEAKLAVQLSHPNIAQIFDLGEAEGAYYIAMEYVDGRSSAALLTRFHEKGEKLPVNAVAFLLGEVAEALHHAHFAEDSHGRPLGVIHRDVSPQNILLSFGGEVKVIDFGLAKAANRASQTQAGVIKGKLAYLSPEQAQGKRIDRRSDLFSLGICAWEMLTGKRAFKREDDRETVLAIRDGKVDRLTKHAEVPPALERIVMKALARDRSHRYRTALEMREDLDRFARTAGLHFGRRELRALMRKTFPERFAGEPVGAISLVNPKRRRRKRQQDRLQSRPKAVPVDTIVDFVEPIEIVEDFPTEETTLDDVVMTEPHADPDPGDTQPSVILPEERDP